MLPPEVTKRLFAEGDIVGLRMKADKLPKVFYLRVGTVEGPNDLRNFSLGAAAGQATAGTGWNEIQDGSSRYILEPQKEKVMYQAFWGVFPSYAWVYRRYPANVDIGSLQTSRTVGDRTYQIGYIDGMRSPYDAPSPETEAITLMGDHPAFYGFHPRTEPASITVRLNFFVTRYNVEIVPEPTMQEVKQAKVRTVGGETLIDAPQWLLTARRG